MSDLLPGLVVLAIGGSIAPPLLLLTILFLGSQRPLPNAGALMLGYFTTCAVIGISGQASWERNWRRQLRAAETSTRESCETVRNARRSRLLSRAQTERPGYERIL